MAPILLDSPIEIKDPGVLMENVLLIILLILALALIAVVLLQRSEGGALGMGGGGGGGGGVMSARGAASALHKITWGLGIAFLAVSLAMTVLSRLNADATSVIDSVGETATTTDTAPATDPAADALMPPTVTDGAATTGTDAPATPPRAN
jgi:preprotein translocase subunit SecG